MMMSLMKMNEYVAIQEKICEKNDYIAPRLYDEYGVNQIGRASCRERV